MGRALSEHTVPVPILRSPDSGPVCPKFVPVSGSPGYQRPSLLLLVLMQLGRVPPQAALGPGVKGQGDLQVEWWALFIRHLENENYVLRQGQDSDPTS